MKRKFALLALTALFVKAEVKAQMNVGGTGAPGSTLMVNGSFGAAYNQVTAASYTMTGTDYYVVYNGTASGAITLPAAGTGTMKGRLYTIKNTTAAQTLTVTPNGAETIDGSTSIAVSPGNSLQIVSTGITSGATWEVVNFAATTTSTGTTLYTGDGTLSGNRIVNQAGNYLLFNATAGETYFRGNTNGLYRTHLQNYSTGANVRTDLQIQSKNSNEGLFMGIDDGSGIFGAGSKAYIDNRAGGRLAFGNSGTEAMTIATTGNVGIGTTTPNAPLQFSNTTVNRKIVLWEDGNNDHQFYGFGVNGGSLRYQSSGSDHVFYAAVNATTSNELMRINSGGIASVRSSVIVDNAGLGTAAMGSSLRFGGGSSGEGIYSNRAATGANINGLEIATSYTPRISILNGGNVGIGTTAPTAKLEVNGTAKINSVPASSASNLSPLYVDGTGNVVTGNASAGVGISLKYANSATINSGATGVLVPAGQLVDGGMYRVTVIAGNACGFTSTAEYWVTAVSFNGSYAINSAGNGIVSTGGTNKSPSHTQNSATQITTTWPGAAGGCADGSNNTTSYYGLSLTYASSAFTLNIINNSNIAKGAGSYTAIVQRLN